MRVDNISGREFEKKVLGKNGKFLVIRNKKNVTFTDALRRTIADWDGTTLHPDTPEADAMYYRVRKYLKGLGVQVDLLVFLRTVETSADILYQTDAVFYLVSNSKEYLVTLDLSFSSNPYMADWFYEVVNENYLQLQSDLYWLKSQNKYHWPQMRPGNHFVLTQFDVFRPRGLKTLSREIALSLFHQVEEGEASKAINKPV